MCCVCVQALRQSAFSYKHITPLNAGLHSPEVPVARTGASGLAVPLCAGREAQAWATAPGTSSKRKCRPWTELFLVQGQEDTACPSVGPVGACQCRTNPVHPSVEAVYHMSYRDPCRPFSCNSFSSGSLQRQITHLLSQTYCP